MFARARLFGVRGPARPRLPMFVLVHHQVRHPERLLERARGAFEEAPHDLYLAHFVPAKHEPLAYSLWVSPSVDAVQEHLEDALEGVSLQDYHEVDEKGALGLSGAEPQGKETSAA